MGSWGQPAPESGTTDEEGRHGCPGPSVRDNSDTELIVPDSSYCSQEHVATPRLRTWRIDMNANGNVTIDGAAIQSDFAPDRIRQATKALKTYKHWQRQFMLSIHS